MNRITGVRAWLREFLRRSAAEARMGEEMRFHIEMETAKNLREGMNPDEAKRRATVMFGGVDRHGEAMRDRRRIRLLEDLLADVRFAVRAMRRRPGFALVAILTLAVAIGSVTTTFSVVSGVALRSLPYADPDRLVSVGVIPRPVAATGQGSTMSRESVELVMGQKGAFEAAAPFYVRDPVLTGLGEPERVLSGRVSFTFFAVLGVQPRLGRAFVPEDATEDRAVVVLSHRFWTSRLGSAPDVLGHTIELDGVTHEVVGVMPPRFEYPRDVQLWQPLPEPLPDLGGSGFPGGRYWVVGRIAPGLDFAETRDRLAVPFAGYAWSGRGASDWGPILQPLWDLIVGQVRTPLVMLLSAVALVLLIACANVAAMLLARGFHRRREIAVRRSLGASRPRVARQLLTEAVVLAVGGGVAGVLAAYVVVPSVVRLIGDQLPRAAEIAVDGRILAAAVAASTITGLLAGSLPALAVVTEDLTTSIKDGSSGGGASAWRVRAGEVLVVAQVALGTLVLAGAALLGMSFVKLMNVDFGFDPARVVVAELRLPIQRYRAAEEQQAFVDEILERTHVLPGAQAAAVSDAVPFAGAAIGSIELLGRETPDGAPWAWLSAVSPDFFRVLGLGLVRGGLEPARAEEPGVVVVNQAFARAFFPGEDPIGRTIKYFGAVEGRIVGVVTDARQQDLAVPPPPQLYYPIAGGTYLKFSIRTAEDPDAVAASLRALIRTVDPLLPIERVDVLGARVSESIARQRLYAVSLGVFSLIALLITALGLYGVTAYSVGRRTREIGIRVALGATAAHIRTTAIGRTARLAVAGVVLGLAGAAFTTRVLETLLFELSPTDPLIFGGVALVLGIAAVLAAYPPARRAARVDPMVALRTD
ncbi:MAG: ADOP family duplicated permease [Longimicrobiales bacterium]